MPRQQRIKPSKKRQERHVGGYHLVFLPANQAWGIFYGMQREPSTWSRIAGPGKHEDMNYEFDRIMSPYAGEAASAGKKKRRAEARPVARRNPRGTLPTYSGHRPTGFDPHLPLAGREDWLIVPVSRNRDSGMLDESNFEAALEILGGESDDVEVHRFGHWGPGWYEIIIVRPGSKAVKEAEEIEAALADYPVLNDEDHSQREYDATISNIRQVLSSVENKNDIEDEFPEDTAEKIFGWLWKNDQRQLDNRDDQGGYPSDEAVEEALQGLGLWAGPLDEEGNVPEVPEHVKQAERERGGQRRLPGVKENPRGAKDWDADELVLYADNTSELYGMKTAIQKNLLKKKKAGKYKPKLAEVAWMHFAEAAAKRYSKEFGGKWHENFPVRVREEAAAQWARTFEESGFEIG